MSFCKFCKKWMDKGTGKRAKEFCNNTCRSNFWYAKNKKGKDVVVALPKEVYDAQKLSEKFIADEPLSFEKLKQKVIPMPQQYISLPVLMAKYFEEKRECQNVQEWKELSDRIEADERIPKQSKIILKTTNQ